MALGSLAISPGMTPLSMGGEKVSERNPLPITIVSGKRDIKGGDSGDALIQAIMDQTASDIEGSKESNERIEDIGQRLLEALTGQDQRGGSQPKPKSASEKANLRDKKIGKSDTSDLADDRKIMTDTLKDAFSGVDGKEGMKMSLKMFLMATGLVILFKFSDQISKFLGPVLGFMKNTLIPGLTSLFKVFVKNPLGIAPFVVAASLGIKRISSYFKGLALAFKEIASKAGSGKFLTAKTIKTSGKSAKLIEKGVLKYRSIITSIGNFFAKITATFTKLGKSFKAAAKVSKSFAVVGKLVGGVSKGVSGIGKLIGGAAKIFGTFMKGVGFVFSIFGKLSGFSKVFGVALKFAKAIPGLGQIIMLIQGIVGAVTGFIDGFKEGGILGGLKGALIGIWDGIVGSFANLIKDLAAWFLGVLGFDKAAEFFSNLDFNFEGIKAGFLFIIDKILGAFNFFLDGLKIMANTVIGLLNKIPGVDIEPFELSGQKKEALTGTSINDEQRQSGGFTPVPSVVSGEVAIGDSVSGMSDRNKKFAIAERIRAENPNMRGGDVARLAKGEFEKTKALKEAQAESTAGGAGIVVVNSSTSNNTNNSNSTTQNMGNMLGSDHTDTTAEALAAANRLG